MGNTDYEKIKWSFSHINLSEWKKSTHRVLFVGAEPNGDKELEYSDMGRWFKDPNNFSNKFYINTMHMLEQVLKHIDDETERKKHMRFVDFKIYGGDAKAEKTDVRKYVKRNISIVNEFFNSEDNPHYVIFTGGISHDIYKEIRLKKIKGISFKDSIKAVLMPHPSSYVSYSKIVEASKSLNINEKINNFKEINKKLMRYSADNSNWTQF